MMPIILRERRSKREREREWECGKSGVKLVEAAGNRQGPWRITYLSQDLHNTEGPIGADPPTTSITDNAILPLGTNANALDLTLIAG